jgi:hypothetical protein
MHQFLSHPLGALGAFVNYMGSDDGFWGLAAAYFFMIFAERIGYFLFKRGVYDNLDALNNIVINGIDFAFDFLISAFAPMVLYVWVYDHWRLIGPLPFIWSIPLAFVAHEICYYIDHRVGHRVGLFWAFHQVHHSSNEFNFTVAPRGFVIDGNIVLFLCAVPFAFLGLPPAIFLGMHAIKSIYGIFNHADYIPKLGILEEFIATPSNHRAHHGVQAKYIDKNYSQCTVILDRLLGTFQKEEERAIVGLITPYYDKNPITTELAGLVWLRNRINSAPRWQDKWKYLWMPPEWTHDGRDIALSRDVAMPEERAPEAAE